MALSRNLRLYIPYHVLSLEGICHGLYVLWLINHKGLSPFVVAALVAAGDLLLAVLHVPTGVLADKLGHKQSLIAGSAAQAAGLTAMWLGQDLWAFAMSAFLIALGDALRGGADEALLFETLRALGREAEFERLVARTGVWTQAALVLLVLIGGALAATASFDAAWALEVALCVAGLGVALALREPPKAAAHGTGAPVPARIPRCAMRRFIQIVLPGAIAGTLAMCAGFTIEATWSAEPQAAFGLTVVVAVLMGSEAIGSYLAERLPRTGSQGWIGWVALALAALALAIPVLVIPVGAVLSLLHGWALPVRAARIQVLAVDGQRATWASAADTVDMVFEVASRPIIGALVWR